MKNESNEYRDRLQSERGIALSELRNGSSSLIMLNTSAVEDLATQSHNQFVAMHQQTMAYEKLRDIDAALARIETGEYGFCRECDEPISGKRLRVIPWASRCVRCQEQANARIAA